MKLAPSKLKAAKLGKNFFSFCLSKADGDRAMLINQFIFSERIQQLFSQQMNMLREFYGSQFQRNIEVIVLEVVYPKQQKQEMIAEESMRTTERFRIAAEVSMR